MLKDHADLLARLTQRRPAQSGHVLTIHQDTAGGRCLQHIHAADQRTLASAAEANDAKDLAPLHLEIDIFKRVHGISAAAIRFTQIDDLDHGHRKDLLHKYVEQTEACLFSCVR